jgi:hypothetical protein
VPIAQNSASGKKSKYRYYSFHSFAIQLIQVPLVAISHRMARLVIIGADDGVNITQFVVVVILQKDERQFEEPTAESV